MPVLSQHLRQKWTDLNHHAVTPITPIGVLNLHYAVYRDTENIFFPFNRLFTEKQQVWKHILIPVKKQNASKLRDLEEQPYRLSETSKNAEYFGLDNVWETERMDAVLNVMPHFMMQHRHRKRQWRRAQVWGSVVLGLSGKRHFELWPADVYISWSKTKTEKKKRLTLCLFNNLH